MKERPILFSAPMVRAILDGSKTQTRRLVKPQPEAQHDGEPYWHVGGYRVLGYRPAPSVPLRVGGNPLPCPYGQPGSTLWVREAWRTSPLFDAKPPRDLPDFAPLRYETDRAIRGAWAGYGYGEQAKYRPPMFMPRWASRITLEITGVRVQLLQDISEADAKAEGAPGYEEGIDAPPSDPADEWSYRASFRRLWESINGPAAWDANPWVWVVEFRQLENQHG